MRGALQEIVKKFGPNFSLNASLDLLEAKIQIMLAFAVNLCLYLLKTLGGEPVLSSESHIELIKMRMLLVKFRPIQAKLENHIDRVLRSSKEASLAGHEAGRLRPQEPGHGLRPLFEASHRRWPKGRRSRQGSGRREGAEAEEVA